MTGNVCGTPCRQSSHTSHIRRANALPVIRLHARDKSKPSRGLKAVLLAFTAFMFSIFVL